MKCDLLIDADMYLYQAASACEVETDWGDDKWTLHSDAKEVRSLFNDTMRKLSGELGGTPVLCFSDPSRRSFRHEICPSYKQSRKNSRKPLAYTACRDQLSTEYKTIIKPRLEADDVMGIVSTRAPGKFIIVSGDKDMQSIPGKLYRQGNLIDTSQYHADYYHMLQTLTGDVTDGYPGCPGIGPVKADQILTRIPRAMTVESMWKRVVEAFKKAGKTEADALLQARLARILRASDWDSEKQEVKLWTPA